MNNYPQIEQDGTKTTKVNLNTNKGTVTLLLFPELAPKTVENF